MYIYISTFTGPQKYMSIKFPFFSIRCHDQMTTIEIEI